MHDDRTEIPYGYCHCGCGRKTRIAPLTDRRHGHVKGEPQPFARGHHGRLREFHGPGWLLDETGCWIWQRAKNSDGYGVTTSDGVQVRAHRLLYERKYGPVPHGMQLHHRCHNPACVNPDHLEPLSSRAHQRKHARLTDDDLERITVLCRSMPQKDVAVMYGVARSTISRIARGIYLHEHRPEGH